MKRKILCVVGTRPEAIKMAPVILALKKEDFAIVRVLATAQHREILDQALNIFGIKIDIDLNVMSKNQSLASLTSKLLVDIDKVLMNEKPNVILVQGDTTTVMTAALLGFYHKIPVGHIEAGLRTYDLSNPFPEEANRIIVSKLAKWHFAPTVSSKNNLLSEKIEEKNIFVTGNTVIDSLLFISSLNDSVNLNESKKTILVTAHRRENFGKPFLNICKAIRYLADKNLDIEFIYPVHPNPNVYEIAKVELGNHPRIILTAPLDYPEFVAAMNLSYFILTDSGGVQEEAPALGKPVLVMRYETERPEAVECGVVRLVGPNYENIIREVQRLLDDPLAYREMAKGISPYGDGRAAPRIVDILKADLVKTKGPD